MKFCWWLCVMHCRPPQQTFVNINWFSCLRQRDPDAGTYPAIMSEEDGITLDVPVDHTLCVEDRQRLQDRQTHCGDLLLVHPGETPERYLFRLYISVKLPWCYLVRCDSLLKPCWRTNQHNQRKALTLCLLALTLKKKQSDKKVTSFRNFFSLYRSEEH